MKIKQDVNKRVVYSGAAALNSRSKITNSWSTPQSTGNTVYAESASNTCMFSWIIFLNGIICRLRIIWQQWRKWSIVIWIFSSLHSRLPSWRGLRKIRLVCLCWIQFGWTTLPKRRIPQFLPRNLRPLNLIVNNAVLVCSISRVWLFIVSIRK